MNLIPVGSRRVGTPLVAVLALSATLLAAAPAALAQTPDARAVLKAMTSYVASQKSIELTFDSDIEIITPQLEKIQFASSGEMLLSRPDKLRAHRVGGFADVALIYDGKTVSVFGKNLDAYTQFPLVGDIDKLVASLRAGYGVAVPGVDLLLTNSYETLMAGVIEAKHLGQGVIDGVECEHLAFRNIETDWQLWVESGKNLVPRKMVVTSKTMNSAPQYTVRIKSWKTDVKPSPGAFVFVPSSKARKLGPNELVLLDELPQGAPAGDKK